MTKYKLYKFSASIYVVPSDEYDYVAEIVESYFMDYCAGLLTSHQLDSFVEECIIENGGKCFDIWCDESEAADIVGLSPYLFQKILNGYIGLNIKEIKDVCEKLNIDYSVALNDGDLKKIFMDKDPL